VLLLALVVAMSGAALAQTTAIDDIQYYDPLTGAPASPLAGTTVTVEGVVYVVKGTYNSGTHYIQGATGGINFFKSDAMPLNYGDRIEVTGTVGVFGGEINVSSPNIVYIGAEAEPTPASFTVSEVMSDYETVGNLATLIGTVTSKGSNNFYITDGDSTIQVYIDSDTGANIGAVDVGDEYAVTGPIVVYNGEIELKPRRQGDLVEDPTGDTVPVVENVNAVNWTPLSTDPINVTATITDDSAISSALLYYRADSGDSTGAFSSVAMTNIGGDVYQGTIPAGSMTPQVDFYVEATDDGAQVSLNPGDAPAGWYEVAVGFTSIYDCQYVHPDSFPQTSPLDDEVVNIQGIVTAGTGDVGSPSKFVLQDGTGPFSGILVYEGTATNFVLPGDEVKVGGYINEYYGLTEMEPHNGSAVYLESFGNDLPEASIVAPDVLIDDASPEIDGDSYSGEAWESVWVRTPVSTVVDTTGAGQYGTFKISSVTGLSDSLTVDPYITLSYAAMPNDRVSVAGFMTYDFGNFELVPIRDADVYLDPSTAVNPTPIMPAGGFSRIAPNPFNPKTEIRFVMTRDNLAQLNVYNIRGELVKTLQNGRLQGGQEYVYHWDGKDGSGRQMSSGTYFARLRLGGDVMQVRKLMLVK
jgi:hypothetical protein